MFSISRRCVVELRRCVHVSACVRGMPPTKQGGKRNLFNDPEYLKHRADRKMDKLNREIKFLLKQPRKVKPVDELNIASAMRKEMSQRKRKKPILDEKTQKERRQILLDYEMHFKRVQRNEAWKVRDMLETQRRALNELRLESETLYQAAIKPLDQLDITFHGPVDTGPVASYIAEDGHFVDTTRKWDKTPDSILADIEQIRVQMKQRKRYSRKGADEEEQQQATA